MATQKLDSASAHSHHELSIAQHAQQGAQQARSALSMQHLVNAAHSFPGSFSREAIGDVAGVAPSLDRGCWLAAVVAAGA